MNTQRCQELLALLQSGGSVVEVKLLRAVGGCYNNAPPMSGVRNNAAAADIIQP